MSRPERCPDERGRQSTTDDNDGQGRRPETVCRELLRGVLADDDEMAGGEAKTVSNQ